MNLFESFNTILDEKFFSKIKANTFDNLGDFEIAIKGIYYTLVAGLIRRSNSDMSAGMLFNQINEHYRKNELPADFLDQLANKAFIDKVNVDGSKIISQIFPAYKSPLLSMISTYAGTSKNSTVLFSGITSSILINLLGEKIKNEKMTKEDMVYFLKQHHDALFKEAPETLMEKMIPALGLQELTLMKGMNLKKPEAHVKNPVEESNSSFTPEESEEGGFMERINTKVVLVILGLLVLGAGGYYVWLNKDTISLFNSDKTKAESIEEELIFEDSLNNAESFEKADTLVNFKADSVAQIALNSTSIDLLNTYLSDNTQSVGKEFEFKNINFIENSSDLTTESLTSIEQIKSLLESNLRLQIKILVFDKNGDSKLNTKKAFAVKRELIKDGIESKRVDAGSGGVGPSFPKIKVISK
jgi:hypothetical protein